jgi:hypothetical protein
MSRPLADVVGTSPLGDHSYHQDKPASQVIDEAGAEARDDGVGQVACRGQAEEVPIELHTSDVEQSWQQPGQTGRLTHAAWGAADGCHEQTLLGQRVCRWGISTEQSKRASVDSDHSRSVLCLASTTTLGPERRQRDRSATARRCRGPAGTLQTRGSVRLRT